MIIFSPSAVSQKTMEWIYDDGGRVAAGYKGTTSDCVVRSIAIASGRPYKEVYDAINVIADSGRAGSRKAKSNSRTGVWKEVYKDYILGLGFHWISTMQIGSGCKVHLKEDELPKGRLIVRLSKHLCAVIDGVIHDTFKDDRDGKRCVYGYYIQL